MKVVPFALLACSEGLATIRGLVDWDGGSYFVSLGKGKSFLLLHIVHVPTEIEAFRRTHIVSMWLGDGGGREKAVGSQPSLIFCLSCIKMDERSFARNRDQ